MNVLFEDLLKGRLYHFEISSPVRVQPLENPLWGLQKTKHLSDLQVCSVSKGIILRLIWFPSPRPRFDLIDDLLADDRLLLTQIDAKTKKKSSLHLL